MEIYGKKVGNMARDAVVAKLPEDGTFFQRLWLLFGR